MVNKSFNDIGVGESATFIHKITEIDIDDFARVSGDMNPLHTNEGYASKTKFGGRVVHGMFLGALVSRLVGMHLPGMRSLLLMEELRFKEPARIGDSIEVRGVVRAKSVSTKIIDIAVEIKKETLLLAEGALKVQILEQ